MRLLPIGLLAISLIVGHVGADPTAQAGKPVALVKAGLLAEITNSQKRAMVPAAGQAFLWIKATASQVQTIDLTKISVMSGATSSSLFGVDGTFDGDPTRFAMIAPAQLKGGALDKPARGILVGRVDRVRVHTRQDRDAQDHPAAAVLLSSVFCAARVSDRTGQGVGCGGFEGAGDPADGQVGLAPDLV